MRQQLRDEIVRLKTESWNELVEKTDLERNSKDFWLSVRRMLGKKETMMMKYLKDHENRMVHEDKSKEEIFRKYWEKILQITDDDNEEFDDETDGTVNRLIENYHQLLHSNTIDYNFPPASEIDIVNIIKTFKQKSPGEDGITKHQLTNLPLQMITNFTTIINESLAIGHFPNRWKQSTMIFIPKGTTPTSHTDYRPISLLNLPGKIMEKYINSKIIEFIDTNSLNNPSQHGFRKNHGTDTATALIYEIIAAGKSNQQKTIAIMRDVSKAFDRVWHSGIIYKMITSNFPEYLIRIIASYLNNRTARIRINKHIGPSFQIKCGVPQGGCMSPVLYTFYNHDLPQPSGLCHNIIYADDITQIIRYPRTANMATAIATREINKINHFEKCWKIKTNIKKFKIVAIGGRKQLTITVNNNRIATTNSATALGTTISSTGFSNHTNNRIKQCKSLLFKLFQMRNLSMKNKRKIYLAIIRTKLTYPTVPLQTRLTVQKKKMQIIQNKAARIISNVRKREKINTELTNKIANLKPINMYLHEQAEKIWSKIEIDDQLADKLQFSERELPTLPSSRKLISAIQIPMY